MRIEEFKAAFTNGVRPSLYSMEIFGLPEKLKFLCKTAQLPGKTIGTIEVPYMGMVSKVAGDVTYDPLSLTIMLDVDFAARNELETWMEAIRNNDAALGSVISEYKRTGNIVQFDTAGVEIAEYEFVGLWPSNIAPLELGFETKDTIAEYTVEFNYDYWNRIT